jgi:hypothetical protein
MIGGFDASHQAHNNNQSLDWRCPTAHKAASKASAHCAGRERFVEEHNSTA